MKEIKDLKIKQMMSSFEDMCFLVYYAEVDGRKITSTILVVYDTNYEEEVREFLQTYSDNMIDIDKLSPSLRNLVIQLYKKNDDIVFVEHNQMTEEEANAIEIELDNIIPDGFQSTYEFRCYGALITLFVDFQSMFNLYGLEEDIEKIKTISL